MKLDLSGRRFGRLLVEFDSGERLQRAVVWSCRCDCGSSCGVQTRSLMRGHTNSCGCLQRELASKSRIVDHSGRRFGMLLVLSIHSGGLGYGRAYAHWLCRCDCGAEKVVRSGALVSGETVSCGCAPPSTRSDAVRLMGRVRGARRRTAQIGAGGVFTADQIKALEIKQRERCAGHRCGKSLKDGYHIDHRLPVSKGGSSDVLNLELLCQTCNQRKHAKDPVVWAQQNGKLL